MRFWTHRSGGLRNIIRANCDNLWLIITDPCKKSPLPDTIGCRGTDSWLESRQEILRRLVSNACCAGKGVTIEADGSCSASDPALTEAWRP